MNPVEIIKIWRGGLASHGGVLGILIAVYIYSRPRADQPYIWLLDRLAIPTALAASFIRLGNFFNSEILGIPTDVPWAVIFQRIDQVPRHPVQLYESITYLAIFGILWYIYRQKGAAIARGFLSGLFLILVFGSRFFLEYFKVVQAAFAEQLPLSMGQLLSIPLVLVGIGLILYSRRQDSS